MRKLPIYAPTSLPWVKWIGYSSPGTLQLSDLERLTLAYELRYNVSPRKSWISHTESPYWQMKADLLLTFIMITKWIRWCGHITIWVLPKMVLQIKLIRYLKQSVHIVSIACRLYNNGYRLWSFCYQHKWYWKWRVDKFRIFLTGIDVNIEYHPIHNYKYVGIRPRPSVPKWRMITPGTVFSRQPVLVLQFATTFFHTAILNHH